MSCRLFLTPLRITDCCLTSCAAAAAAAGAVRPI